jgi:hypothetical protein
MGRQQKPLCSICSFFLLSYSMRWEKRGLATVTHGFSLGKEGTLWGLPRNSKLADRLEREGTEIDRQKYNLVQWEGWRAQSDWPFELLFWIAVWNSLDARLH